MFSVQKGNLMFKNVGIVGAGITGTGIARLAVLSRTNILLFDVNGTILRRSIESIKSDLRKMVNHGRMTADELGTAVSCLHTRTNLPDLEHCDCIFEAVTEDLRVKKDIFKHLDANTKSSTVLCTTSSSFPVSAVSALAKNPQRIIGTHFFDPVNTNKLVEIVRGIRTDDATVRQTVEFIKSLKKTPVIVKDSPGFIVNRISHPMFSESLSILGDNIATAEQIDRIVRTIGGFPAGPFETMDDIGLDKTLELARATFEQSNGNPSLRPSSILDRMVESGLLGKKSGEGFFRYNEETKS
jgi:3-hydroxybutyryl-CoA dehydrogenase